MTSLSQTERSVPIMKVSEKINKRGNNMIEKLLMDAFEIRNKMLNHAYENTRSVSYRGENDDPSLTVHGL